MIVSRIVASPRNKAVLLSAISMPMLAIKIAINPVVMCSIILGHHWLN